MKFILMCITFSCVLFANTAFIIPKFSSPDNCKGCHQEQYKDWSTSLHSQSHEDKNELYKQSVSYVSRSMHLPYEQVLVECGKCHNPRLEIKNTSSDYMLAKAFDVNTEETQKNDQALKAKHIQNGISCYICHNADSISSKHQNSGYEQLNWVGSDTIVGPFGDSTRAQGFHKLSQRNFFRATNELCLVCHEGKSKESTLANYETGTEMKQDTSLCANCHMKPFKEDKISPSIEPEKAKMRTLKSHFFAGIRNSDLATEGVEMSFDFSTKILKIKNLTPHKIPTGFSGRKIVVNASVYNSAVGEVLSKQTYDIFAFYVDKNGLQSLSYNAVNLKSDTRLEPYETRELKLDMTSEADKIEVEMIYYIIDPSLLLSIPVKDEKFTKPYEILKKTFIK